MQTAAPGSSDPGFVRRERELDQLSLGLDDTLAGRERLFLVVGEPGIGLDEEGPASIAAGVVPSAVRDVIWQRLGRVADDTRALLNRRRRRRHRPGRARAGRRVHRRVRGELAKLDGASEAEIGEAVGMAAITRHWSTFLNGIQTDETKLRAEIAKIIAHVKASAGKAPGGNSVTVTDGDTALAEATQLLGIAPELLQQLPAAARAGAWRRMRDVQMSPATDAEIAEAIAMAAFAREMSTMLNGMQVDEAQYRKDVDHLVKSFSPKKQHASR